MPAILRLSKTLSFGAEGGRECASKRCGLIRIRHYLGPGDALPWLQVQQEALPSQRGGRLRTEADFRRMWLTQSWWRPDRLMFACLHESSLEDCDSHRVVGTIGFRPVTAATARLFWLAVRPRWQRRGVGRSLVQAVEQQCVRSGIYRLELETLPDWSGAIAFYRSLGFSVQ